jgi:hypothetical protein
MASLIAFVGLVIAISRALVLAVRATAADPSRDTSRAIAAITGWLVITALIPMSRVLEHDVVPPPAMLFFATCNVAALALALSPLGARLARGLPAVALVGFQAFRLPLELVLASWAAAGTIPVQMSLHGDNFDIVTGVAALLLALVLLRRRSLPRAELAFHALGLLLLVRVMMIAVLSSPVPFRSYEGPLLLLAYHAPYAWIVSICVAGALAGHVIGIRSALARRPPGV